MALRRFSPATVVSLASMAVALACPAGVAAQFRASELGSVSQTIDGTRMTVEFSRPQARTRDSLFGKVVRWGETWTPGANWATTLEVSKDVKINGLAVAKGKYRESMGSGWSSGRRRSGPWCSIPDFTDST